MTSCSAGPGDLRRRHSPRNLSQTRYLSPSVNGLNAYDAMCWWQRFSADQHVALRHSLGNLVLTLDNSHYSYKCFDQKRGSALDPGEAPTACYAQASLHQERDLAAFADWTPDTIRDRQQQLTAWALRRWAVASPDASVLEPEEAEPEIEAEDEDDQVDGQ